MAFFLQGDFLLLNGDSENLEFPIELAEKFENPDIFSVPALDGSAQIHVVSVPVGTELTTGWKSIPVRQLLSMAAAEDAAKVLRACHLAQWRTDSRFCGRCGSVNNDVQGAAQRQCLNCGKSEFPRICPAMIVLITDGENRILLAHNKKFKTGVYSHISGFNEAGETLEETVVREVREEVNIEVCNIEYIKSQPWPFPNSLMVGFKANYASGTIKPDGEEIEDAKWFTKDNLPDLPGEGSLSRFIIERWLKGTI